MVFIFHALDLLLSIFKINLMCRNRYSEYSSELIYLYCQSNKGIRKSFAIFTLLSCFQNKSISIIRDKITSSKAHFTYYFIKTSFSCLKNTIKNCNFFLQINLTNHIILNISYGKLLENFPDCSYSNK